MTESPEPLSLRLQPQALANAALRFQQQQFGAYGQPLTGQPNYPPPGSNYETSTPQQFGMTEGEHGGRLSSPGPYAENNARRRSPSTSSLSHLHPFQMSQPSQQTVADIARYQVNVNSTSALIREQGNKYDIRVDVQILKPNYSSGMSHTMSLFDLVGMPRPFSESYKKQLQSAIEQAILGYSAGVSDLALKGFHFVEPYHPTDLFSKNQIDDDEKYFEMPSMMEVRKQRILWLAHKIARTGQWLTNSNYHQK
ncbi:hypothetical protein F5Y17DRAFT_463816 [Xylariaceae sp. FL0594]|nr:hypothetical protein F5Y17DRAFT_463816 [Xylariaceae sp. FL0594]